MKLFPYPSIFSIILIPALVMAPLWAQTPITDVAKTGAAPDVLQIRVLDVESLQTGVHSGAKQSFGIEVTDAGGATVANAAVTCRLPDSGPTGTFGDGSHAAVAYTDGQGRASIDGIQWSEGAGAVTIRLTATKGTAHTGILLETNLTAAPVKTATVTPVAKVQQVIAPVNQAQPASTQPVAAQPVIAQASPAQPIIAQPTVSVTKPSPGKQPGQVAQAAKADPSSIPDPGPNRLTPATTPTPADPPVSVTRTSAADAPHSSRAKWYVLALVAVGAGAGAAFAMKGKSTSTSSNSASLSIGNPSISVGHP
jgi:hypothetical protein